MARNSNKISIDKILFHPKTNKLEILSRLKFSSFSEFRKEIKKAYRYPLTKSYIQGNHKPKSYSELRDTKLSYYSNNLEGELAWLLESVLLSKDDVINFVRYEKILQKHILLGENDNAEELLNEINSKVCFSYWGLEIKYYLTERLEGTEGNWKFSSGVNASTTNSFTLFFNQVLSKKSEQGVSCSDYHRSLHNEIRSVNAQEFEYLNYKLGYHHLKDYTNYSFFIYADLTSSLIDKYISLINIISELLSSFDSVHNQIAIQALRELDEINDVRINRLKEFCGLKIVDVETQQYVEILENYTTGNYEKCIDVIPNILRNYPESVELWDIYVKSIIESGKEFASTGISKYFDEVLKKLYVTYLIQDDSIQKAEELLKLVISTPNLSYAKQLLALISSTLGIDSNKNVIRNNFYFHSVTTNPILFLLSDTVQCTPVFESLKTSQCIKLIAGKPVDTDAPKSYLSEFKFTLYNFRRAFKIENFEDCISISKIFELKDIKNNIFIEEIIYILYHSFCRTSNFDEAIKIYVSFYFNNNNLIKRIDTSWLIGTIIDENYPISGSVDNAIFFNLNNLDNYYCFVTLEMWLESLGIEKPSELIMDPESNEFEKILFLLENGCSVEVLEKFYYIYDTKAEVIEERKKILSILIQNDSLSSERFINELSALTQKGKVQSILQEVNSGRIRLTKNMLDPSNENNYESSFNRYRLLMEFTEHFEYESYDVKTLLKNFIESIVESKNVTITPSFLTFRSLVNELIDGFLFNKKNGLDGELSTRVRHGELENQIRSVFDRKFIISKKDDTNEYTDILYWNNLFSTKVDGSILQELQSVLKRFSLKIDLIIQNLVKEYIQVKSENYPVKSAAFFNYYFTENYFKLLYDESKSSHESFDKFSEYIYSVLQAHTESYLEKVSDYLTDDLRKTIDEELDMLAESVSELSINFVELNQNIIDAKVEFQNEILDIAKWFRISDSTIDTALDVRTIIECSFESSNLKHPNRNISPVINADEQLFINNYKHFIFILINLIENIRAHSKLSTDKLKVEVNVTYENDILLFSIKNNYDLALTREDELKSIFHAIKHDWNNEVKQEFVNKEKGSGYEKIKKILAYDIKSKNNTFDFRIDGDTLELLFGIEISYNYEING